jgi:lysophospholipase L1-like esterase
MKVGIMLVMSLLLSGPALGQQSDKDRQEQEAEVRLHQDWAWLGRYQAANAALTPDPKNPRIVFLGDSITQGWIDKMPSFFSSERIDRGIGGQTTPQMLLRFRQDVVDLHPAVVQIMGGTNDIASNTGPMTPEQTQANIMSMCDIARANGIRVILASIPPAANFPWRPGLEVSSRIETMNLWLKAYAARIGGTYADYWSALHDGHAQRAAFTYDGVHPNEAGYATMAPVAETAIRAALSEPAAKPL